MTDTNWVGVTPHPPSSCDRSRTCAAEVHQIGCVRVRETVLKEDHLIDCEQYGHRFEVITKNEVPVRVRCTRCDTGWAVP